MYNFHVNLRLDQIVRLEALTTCVPCPTGELVRQALDEYLARKEGGAYDGMPPLAVLETLEANMLKRLAQCRAEICTVSGGEKLEK